MPPGLLIYGATGYTGALVSRTAAARGLAHAVAARNAARLHVHAQAFGLPMRTFGLDDPARLDKALDGVQVLLNCAGPFGRTAPPLVDACLRRGVHYLDLAGEAPEFEALAARDREARDRGVMLLPGVGFGVVPSDCLAALVARDLPSARRLVLAFAADGGVSRGTLGTVLGGLHESGATRRDGRLVPAEPAEQERRVPLGDGERPVVTNPWRGDLVTAYRSTAIPDIETYTAFPRPLVWLMRSHRMRRLLGSPRGARWLARWLARLPEGPSEEQLRRGRSAVYAEASAPDGQVRRALLRGPDAYLFTARAAVAAAAQVLAGQVSPGMQTPATALGPEFVLGLEGVELVREVGA